MDRRSPLAALFIAGLLGACPASAQRKLDRHVFDVPAAHDIPDSGAPFFLPALDARDGFSFTLNPEASLAERNLIAVASKVRICARAGGTGARINATICAAPPPSWRGRALRKISDGVFWTYDLPAEEGRKSSASLASCSAVVEGSGSGLCNASLLYGDLVLTIHFRDDRIASLETLYDRATAFLRRWER